MPTVQSLPVSKLWTWEKGLFILLLIHYVMPVMRFVKTSRVECTSANRSVASSLIHRRDVQSGYFDTVPDIPYLHQTIGNRAVGRLFRSGYLQATFNNEKADNRYRFRSVRIAEQVMQTAGPLIQRRKGRRRWRAKRRAAGKRSVPIRGTILLPSGSYTIYGSMLLKGYFVAAHMVIDAKLLRRGRLPKQILYYFQSSAELYQPGKAKHDLLQDAMVGSQIRHDKNPPWAWIRTIYGWHRVRHRITYLKRWSGYQKYGGPPAWKKINELKERVSPALKPEEIEILSGMAAAETGGRIGAVNTFDDAVVSMGFTQVTLKYGTLQEVIKKTKAAFAKYNIALDNNKRNSYRGHPMIKGVKNANELRSPKWASRFFAASMEPAVIVALIELARKKIKLVGTSISQHAGKRRIKGLRFFDAPITRALLTTVYNNRPVYPQKVIRLAIKDGAAHARTLNIFVHYYMRRAIKAAYKNDPVPSLAWQIYSQVTKDAKNWQSRRSMYKYRRKQQSTAH
jgi:hypothetical protein